MSVVCHPTPQCLSFHMDRNTVVQLLNYILLFVTSWIAAHQAFLSFTISWSLLKLMSIKLVMPSNHLILCRPLLLPSKSFPGSKSLPVSCLFPSRGQSIGDSASASVLSMNIQGWFLLELTGLISLQSKGLFRVFSSTTIRKHLQCSAFFWSNSHIRTWLL